MTEQKVNTLADLGSLTLRLKPDVLVSKAGGFFRARYPGKANCVFGTTREQAIARLKSVRSKKRGIVPVRITHVERLLMAGLR